MTQSPHREPAKGRARPSDQALAVPAKPASGLDASRFDPSRIPQLVGEMRSVADCDARAGEPLGRALRKGADAIVHLFDALDRIANETDTVADFDGYFLRDVARAAIWRGYIAQ